MMRTINVSLVLSGAVPVFSSFKCKLWRLQIFLYYNRNVVPTKDDVLC